MDFDIPKEKQIDETEEFRLFSGEIDYLSDFFGGLSDLMFLNGRIITFFSKTQLYTLDTALIDSAAQTLRSIKFCCSIGGFSDANTLVRKLRDDLVQYAYILNTINLRKPFLEESTKNINAENPEEFANSILNLQFNNELTEDEQAVTAWFENAVADLKRPIKKKLEFENYMNVLKQNDKINHILTEYKLQQYWETLRKRLNNYVHGNGCSVPRHNYVSATDKNLGVHLKNVSTRATYVSSFFIIVLLMIESSLVSATDYIDHLDCGMEPPEGSQYSIAGFIQDFIDKKVSTIHPELKHYLQHNNIHGMRIE